MGKRARTAAMAGAGLMAVVAPLIGGAEPAAAQVNTVEQSGALTFVDYGGSTPTCRVLDIASHDTSANTAGLRSSFTGGSDCFGFGHITVNLTLTYKDERGVAHEVNATADDDTSFTVDHAKSDVKTTVRVHYSDCNPNASATCDLTVTANPK
jgi:hypothetical protein